MVFILIPCAFINADKTKSTPSVLCFRISDGHIKRLPFCPVLPCFFQPELLPKFLFFLCFVPLFLQPFLLRLLLRLFLHCLLLCRLFPHCLLRFLRGKRSPALCRRFRRINIIIKKAHASHLRMGFRRRKRMIRRTAPQVWDPVCSCVFAVFLRE